MISAALLAAAPACDRGAPDCGVADQVKILDSGRGPLTDHYLVLRISGFQDKVLSYELYRGQPLFDTCGRADREPLSAEPIDESAGYVAGLEVTDHELQIQYSQEAQSQLKPDAVRLPDAQ